MRLGAAGLHDERSGPLLERIREFFLR